MLRLLTTVNYDLSIKHPAPQIWELVPQNVRKCKILNQFKEKVKSWYPDHCPCRLCKTYIAQLGFTLSMHASFYDKTGLYVLVIIKYLQYVLIMLP